MRSEVSSIKKNTFYSTITIFSRLFANVFLFWLLARFYGPEQFGIFTFAHSLATTFIILADFGLDVLLVTQIAAFPEKRKSIVEKLFGIKLIFVSLAFISMIIASQIFPVGRKSLQLMILFGFYLVFTSLTNFLFGIFRGYEKFIYETRVSLISNISLLILAAIFFVLKSSLLVIAFLFILTRVIGFLAGFLYLKSLDSKFKFEVSFSELGILKNKTLIFGIHLIFSYLFFQIDTLLLAKLSGEYSVGIYQSVFKLIMLPLVIPDILNNSLMPTLSRLYREFRSDWVSIGISMSKILMVIIVPISLILFFYSSQLIDIVYGLKRFNDAVIVLKIFGIILFVRFLLEPFALILTTSDKQKIRMKTVIVATVISVGLNLYFIPRYNVYGAAIVSLIINSFVGFIYFISTEKEFRSNLLKFKNLSMIVFSILIAFFIKNYLVLNFIIQILLIVGFYILFIYNYYLTKSEKDLFNLLIRKLKF